MSNRVIKDLIWASPKLAKCTITTQLHFPRLVLLSDDWGCFNADAEVIKGLAYPKMKITPKKIFELLKELYDMGLLFVWRAGHHTWGYWMKWDEHGFSSGSEYNNGGQRVKHRRKTPVPPERELKKYISEHLGTIGDNLEKSASYPNPNPNPNLNPKPKQDPENILHEKEFTTFWSQWPSEARAKKTWCEMKFNALCKVGKLKEFKKTTMGYSAFLTYQKDVNNFPQRCMDSSTWFNNWEGDKEKYINFKSEPPL